MPPVNDKELERQRYDARAAKALKNVQSESGMHLGASSIPIVLRAPYSFYECELKKVLKTGSVALEIGSGTGEFTDALLRSGATVVASDISQQSLELLRARYPEQLNLYTCACDMESLPFPDGSFDVVASAGSLSYGDNKLLLGHIYRLLKPGGSFICVDSLNHHPVYRINRYVHFLRGNRSCSTMQRMPTCDLIKQYQVRLGGESAVTYFGGASWLIMIFSRFGFESFWAKVSDRFDRFTRVRKSAFKFVLIARKAL